MADWIKDGFDYILYNFVYRIFYYLEIVICRAVGWMQDLFNSFTGVTTVTYKGDPDYLSNVFFGNTMINGAYWGMALIGIAMAFIFALVAIVKKLVDVGGEKMKASVGQILGTLFKSIMIILALNVGMTVVTNFTNVLLQSIVYVFDHSSEIGMGDPHINYTSEQYAAMARIFNTVGNYSLNPSYKNRYNLNACYNEIRGDLGYLADQKVFSYYYITKDDNGNEVETWQSALQKLANAADYTKEQPVDVYHEGIANALSEVMTLLKSNSSMQALAAYDRPVMADIDVVPMDSTVFLTGTMGMGDTAGAKNDAYNKEPSFTDPIRAPYYMGAKSIYDLDTVNEDFDIAITKTNYLVVYVVGAALIKNLAVILLSAVVRLFNMLFLYLIAPPVIATMPLDDGGKFKQWMTAFIVQSFSIFATIISMKLVLIFIPIVMSPQLVISDNSFLNVIAKLILLYGGIVAVSKANGLLTGILADSAGWQSITAGDVSSTLANSSLGKLGSSIASLPTKGAVGLAGLAGKGALGAGKLAGKGLLAGGKLAGKGLLAGGKGIAAGGKALGKGVAGLFSKGGGGEGGGGADSGSNADALPGKSGLGGGKGKDNAEGGQGKNDNGKPGDKPGGQGGAGKMDPKETNMFKLFGVNPGGGANGANQNANNGQGGGGLPGQMNNMAQQGMNPGQVGNAMNPGGPGQEGNNNGPKPGDQPNNALPNNQNGMNEANNEQGPGEQPNNALPNNQNGMNEANNEGPGQEGDNNGPNPLEQGHGGMMNNMPGGLGQSMDDAMNLVQKATGIQDEGNNENDNENQQNGSGGNILNKLAGGVMGPGMGMAQDLVEKGLGIQNEGNDNNNDNNNDNENKQGGKDGNILDKLTGNAMNPMGMAQELMGKGLGIQDEGNNNNNDNENNQGGKDGNILDKLTNGTAGQEMNTVKDIVGKATGIRNEGNDNNNNENKQGGKDGNILDKLTGGMAGQGMNAVKDTIGKATGLTGENKDSGNSNITPNKDLLNNLAEGMGITNSNKNRTPPPLKKKGTSIADQLQQNSEKLDNKQ